MKEIVLPYIINLPSIGNNDIGFLAIMEDGNNLPFAIRRVYWAYNLKNGVIRGHHAHHEVQQILICVHGEIKVNTIQRTGEKHQFLLKDPAIGLFLPATSWHTMEYTSNAIEVVLASEVFDEKDYIRNFDEFMN